MKSAVIAAAADMPGDNHEESDVVRVAVEEYLARRGYLKAARAAEPSATYRTARKKKRTTPAVAPANAARHMAGDEPSPSGAAIAKPLVLVETLSQRQLAARAQAAAK